MIRKLVILSGLVVSLALASSAHAEIKKGPFIAKVTKHGGSIVWETESSAAGTVEWGTTEDLGEIIEAPQGVMHEVRITDLDAGKPYYYSVTSDGESTEVFRFVTAPPATKPFRFVAFGDSRSGYADHRRVTEGILADAPEIYLNSGDLACTGEDETCWQQHFTIERELMATAFLLPALGNHDTAAGGDVSNYKRYFANPPINASEEHEYDEQFYSVDWGNTRFIVLDDQVASLGKGSLQYDWMIWLLEDAKKDPNILHIFIALHVGPYSAKPDRSGNGTVRSYLDLLASYGVTAIFSGHDHHYYRGVDPTGLNFIVTGGGGAGLYDCVPKQKWGVYSHQCVEDFNYVVFDVNGRDIHAVAKTSTGQVIEEFDWKSDKIPPEVVEDGDNDEDGDTDDPGTDPYNPDNTDPDGDDGGGFRPSEQNSYDAEMGFAGCRQQDCGVALLFLLLLLGGFAWLRRRSPVE